MNTLLDGILFKKDKKRFDHIEMLGSGFARQYIGNNIIRDGIFMVIENYARTKEVPLEWIRLPVDDPELCACTFVRSGRIFVMVNTTIPYSKQIFAAAHELYHIKCYLEDEYGDLESVGSILKLNTIDEGTTEIEEMEANAFAGVLLAPSDYLNQQIDIFGIDMKSIKMDDVLALVDIFAIPYKAMVLRLVEEVIIDRDTARELLKIPVDKIRKRMDISGKGKRWDIVPEGNEMLGSLEENLIINAENEALPISRIENDKSWLEKIKHKYRIQ